LKKVLLALLALIGLVAFFWARGAGPVTVPTTKVERTTLVSTLNTNGKVEPIEWAAVRSETAGSIEKIYVERGQRVKKGQILVQLGTAAAQSELETARSRISQAKAELETLTSGGRAGEVAEIESGLARATSDLAAARREVASLERQVSQKAATQAELTAARETLARADLQIQALNRRRTALVTEPDRRSANARLAEAEAGARAAARRIEIARISSPMDGILYNFSVRVGAYVNPGDLIAEVGVLDRLRVIVYVDEPELGRVEAGMPVSITWDAAPGRHWKGAVDRVPLQVSQLGTRQVGEVWCAIENEGDVLIPGTNINAEIRSRVVDKALSVPKEVLRREGNETGVFKLGGDKLVWQPIRIGTSSVTHVEVLSGLVEGDMVALPVDQPVKAGDTVNAVQR
jgi:HlyD family secretion protein